MIAPNYVAGLVKCAVVAARKSQADWSLPEDCPYLQLVSLVLLGVDDSESSEEKRAHPGELQRLEPLIQLAQSKQVSRAARQGLQQLGAPRLAIARAMRGQRETTTLKKNPSGS